MNAILFLPMLCARLRTLRSKSATGTQTVDRLVLAVGADVAAQLVSHSDLNERYSLFADALRQVEDPQIGNPHWHANRRPACAGGWSRRSSPVGEPFRPQ